MSFDLVKGVFRRATQTVRESVGKAEGSGDPILTDATNKIHLMEKSAATLSEKVMKLSKAFEDIGSLMHEVGEEYKKFAGEVGPAASPEIVQLAGELSAFGQEFNNKAQETGRQLKESGFDVMGAFTRETHSLKAYEEDRRKKQLEYDFFNTKTNELVRNPPKDAHDRIPRNETIRENWRVQLHGSTEAMKVAVSNIHTQGLKSLDLTVYTICIATGNLLNYGLNSVKVHFANARLPVYRTEPILAPAQLAPAPNRWVPPAPAPYQPYPSQQTGGSPGQQQQQQPPYGGGPQQPPPPGGQYQQQQQQPQSWNGQQQQQQQPQSWNNQPPQQQQQQQQPQSWNNNGQPQQQQQYQQQPPQSTPPQSSFGQPPNASFNNNGQQQQQQPPPAQPQSWNQSPPQQQQQAPPPSAPPQQQQPTTSPPQQATKPPAPAFNPFEPASAQQQQQPQSASSQYVPPPKPDDGDQPPPLN